ncbi:MAG: serine/threonine protein kinase [Gemmataceae bacterium]
MDPLTHASPHPGRLPSGELDLTGRTLGDFHIVRHLGQGGMGQVYLAEQISLKRKVALKILRPEMAVDPTALQRFKAEAAAVARASHANIVQIHAIGEADGIAYMALEYVEGKNLHEFLVKKGPPDLLLILAIMRQVASALQRAAELGIVHRDIKPDNILLTRKGEIKVADFGLSRCLAGGRTVLNLTQAGMTMGTPLYMSPEQVEGKTLDCRTDIYSLGVTCYHMLAGHPPFQGDSSFAVALQHVRAEPKPLHEIRPDLPTELCAIVHKMMAKDVAARYQTGRELLKDIARLREGLNGKTAAPSPTSVELAPTPPARGASKGDPLFALRASTICMGVGSLLLAGSLGAAVAWFQHRLAYPSHAAAAPAPPDGKETVSEQEEEKALRTVVEQYLLAEPSAGFENQAHVEVCASLGLFYLECDRLDDALKHFTRMAQHSGQGYPLFGQVGRAVTLALQNKANQSNELFRRIYQRARPRPALNWLWQEAKWRFWVRKALHYNLENGVKREDIPQQLHKAL